MASSLNSALKELEDEAVFVIRETAAQFERPALLFSGGKDSIVLANLASRAFAPAPIPFPFLHIDTGHNFHETIKFRDDLVKKTGAQLIVRYVQDSIDQGLVKEETGPNRSRNALQTVTLLDAIKELNLDACIGGARRDEEKARAKERFFSHRNAFGQWDPKNQRPELWDLYNGRKAKGEQFRVFPLSNWTELDVWGYIQSRHIPVPSLYFSHERATVVREGALLAYTEFLIPNAADEIITKRVRFRTIGDATCTGATESYAESLEDVIAEIAASRSSERSSRADDKRSENAMEDRKSKGYF
ncbi:MAG TPA: sulfate adenylyltransferase subunit CysD [Fimbriimonadaceae bacterium]|jgi:sulfate adenylyltransferase subunit 2